MWFVIILLYHLALFILVTPSHSGPQEKINYCVLCQQQYSCYSKGIWRSKIPLIDKRHEFHNFSVQQIISIYNRTKYTGGKSCFISITQQGNGGKPEFLEFKEDAPSNQAITVSESGWSLVSKRGIDIEKYFLVLQNFRLRHPGNFTLGFAHNYTAKFMVVPNNFMKMTKTLRNNAAIKEYMIHETKEFQDCLRKTHNWLEKNSTQNFSSDFQIRFQGIKSGFIIFKCDARLCGKTELKINPSKQKENKLSSLLNWSWRIRILNHSITNFSIECRTKSRQLNLKAILQWSTYSHSFAKNSFQFPLQQASSMSNKNMLLTVGFSALVFIIILLGAILGIRIYQHPCKNTYKQVIKESNDVIRPRLLSVLSTTSSYLSTFSHDQHLKEEEQLENVSSYFLPEWADGRIFNWNCFEIGSPLGEGKFGKVNQATLTTPGGARFDVAIKGIKENLGNFVFQQEELIKEGYIMAKIGYHQNIVNLQGVTTNKKWRFFLILEHCAHGALVNVLRRNRIEIEHILKQELNPERVNPLKKSICISSINMLLGWCHEVASGMAFLGHHEVVHGDLAARNVLLTSELTAKISDFGLAHRLYQLPTAEIKSKAQPTRWMAIEALSQLKVTKESDIWSYGVFIWEVFSAGRIPYSGIRNEHILSHLLSGVRLQITPSCPLKVRKIMNECWSSKPASRPTFDKIVTQLQQLISAGYIDKPNTAISDNADRLQHLSDRQQPNKMYFQDTSKIEQHNETNYCGTLPDDQMTMKNQSLSKSNGNNKQLGIDSNFSYLVPKCNQKHLSMF